MRIALLWALAAASLLSGCVYSVQETDGYRGRTTSVGAGSLGFGARGASGLSGFRLSTNGQRYDSIDSCRAAGDMRSHGSPGGYRCSGE